MSLADSLYNLQLVQEFCRNNLNGCCHFSLEDMLYAHASIKVGGRRSGARNKTRRMEKGLFMFFCQMDWVEEKVFLGSNKLYWITSRQK